MPGPYSLPSLRVARLWQDPSAVDARNSAGR